MVLLVEMQIGLDGEIVSRETVDTETQDGYPLLQCPYCLFSSYHITDFVIVNRPKRGDSYSFTLESFASTDQVLEGTANQEGSTKPVPKQVLESGKISKKRALCPKCHNTEYILSLKIQGKRTPEEYGVWVARSLQWDTNRRVRIGKGGPIRAFLEKFDIANEFWTAYKEEKKKLDPNWIPWDQRAKPEETSG